jgi:hypothetical protein
MIPHPVSTGSLVGYCNWYFMHNMVNVVRRRGLLLQGRDRRGCKAKAKDLLAPVAHLGTDRGDPALRRAPLFRV